MEIQKIMGYGNFKQTNIKNSLYLAYIYILKNINYERNI